MHESTDAQTLNRLVARCEIQDLLQQYGWTIDGNDWDGWIAMFTVDGVFASGGVEHVGRAAVLDVAQRTYAKLSWMRRFLAIPHIRVDGDDAWARANFQVSGATRTGKEVVGAGTYTFALLREDGVWRIARCDADFDHYTHLRLPGGWGARGAEPPRCALTPGEDAAA
jgi:uncharacterized protein (TIGR02246 family)